MSRLLDGKVALITGGARGQGRAHATTCAREGADVVVVDTTSQIESVPYDLATGSDLDQTRAAVEALGRRIIIVDADVRDQVALDGAVDSAISEFGGLDILIANAGVWSYGAFWEMSEQQWNTVIDVNLNGVWRAAKAVAPQMIKQGKTSTHSPTPVSWILRCRRPRHYSSTRHLPRRSPASRCRSTQVT